MKQTSLPFSCSFSIQSSTGVLTLAARYRGTKSGEATARSAHESLDARPGNLTELSNYPEVKWSLFKFLFENEVLRTKQ